MPNKEYATYKELVEKRLTELLDLSDVHPTIKNAMNYSVCAGGKRLRPVLNIMANALLDGDTAETLDIACAMECIHTYSLIHDDLPAMDNDDLRRGKPTNHVMFGEPFAILAGDALLNFAFETMIANAQRHPQNLPAHLEAMRIVARGAGVYGMITGQCADLENEAKILTERELEYIHYHKTSALIEASLLSGIALCSPNQTQKDALNLYGRNIGLSFQIIDDILDITSDEKTLGKSVGKDKDAHKFTFPILYGIDQSRQIVMQKTQEAVDALSIFGSKAQPLIDLAQTIAKRDH